VLLAVLTQLTVPAVDGVGGAPRHGDPSGHGIGEQLGAQLRFGLELQLARDAHRGALGVVGQLLGRPVQPGTDQGMPTRAAVGGVDEVDRVGHLAGAAHVLAFDPARGGSGLLVTTFIEDQHDEPIVGEVLDDEVADRGHRGEGVPRRAVQ